MKTFFDSSFFAGLATIITGAVALVIYYVQKRNSKVQAARVLLTEIRIAENRIDQIRDKILNDSTSDLPSVFPTQSWKTYSHLFVSDFDEDELKLINSFYDFGSIIEEFAERNNNYFWIVTEERAKISVQKISEFVMDSYGVSNPDNDIKLKRDFLTKGLDMYNSPYAPKKTLDGIRDYLTKINNITTSSCGLKLKKIARL